MNRKTRDILNESCRGAAVLFAVVFGFAAGCPRGANAEAAFGKLVEG